MSHIGIHDGDPPLLHQEDIGQPRQKGGFPGVWGTKEQDRTSLSEVIQRGLPTRLLYKPRHRLYLSISRADDVPPGPRLPQYSLLLDAPLRRSRHQPPHRYRRDLFGGRPTRHGAYEHKEEVATMPSSPGLCRCLHRTDMAQLTSVRRCLQGPQQ